MTIQELYDKLCDEEFQNPQASTYNYYMYQYSAKDEYNMVQEIQNFVSNLKRPAIYVDVFAVDLFELLCKYLDEQSFSIHPSYLKFLLEKDDKDPDNVTKILGSKATSDKFLQYLDQHIATHLEKPEDGLKRPYVFIYGMGKIFPYLRTRHFLSKFEKFNRPNDYKIIVFYPGVARGNSFTLLGCIEDSHTYRAELLN